MWFPECNVSLTLPNFTTAATNGATTLYDKESMLTSNHGDSDVPQQCARARSYFLWKKWGRNYTFGVQNNILQGL